MKQLFTIIFLLIGTIQTNAQHHLRFENIGVREGLSAIHVNQIIQDKQQFIWIATANGLNRFDGIDFNVFVHEPENNHSISGNNIRCLLEDSHGYIWAGTLNDGLNRYDYRTGKFTNFVVNEADKTSISNNEILSLFEDSQGRLWIGTEDGLNLFDYETETFSTFLPDENDETSISKNAVLTIAEDNRGWIWVGTWGGGLNLVIPTKKPKKFTFRHFKQQDETGLLTNNIWKIFVDDYDRIWCGTFGGGLSMILPNKETNLEKFVPQFQTFLATDKGKPIISDIVFGINQDKEGTLWLATIDGVSLVKPTVLGDKIELTSIKHLQNHFMDVHSLVNNEMRDVFIDNNGLVWCSTLGGISKFDKNNAHFKHLLPLDKANKNILVHALLIDNDKTIYIASRAEYGLIESNQNTNAYKNYFLKTTNGVSLTPTSFFKAKNENIWIGTQLGIGLFNTTTKSFKHYDLIHQDGKQLTNPHVRKIFQDDKNQLWLATGSGLVVFNMKHYTFEVIDEDSKGNSLENLDINDLLFDNQTLWLASYGSLGRLDFKKDNTFIYKEYKNEADKESSICSNRVISLAKFNKKIWIGTENGLMQYNSSTDDFRNYTTKDGLKNPNIVALLSNGANQLWIATRNGLEMMNTKTKSFIHYDQKDGINLGAFSQNAVGIDHQNNLYFGGKNGYIQFNSQSITTNPFIPPVRITGFKVFNKNFDWKEDIAIAKTITLQPDQNHFTVEFAALNYTQSEDNVYAYKLVGFNDDWIYCSNQKSVSFSNLDGGTYVLKIKATNNDGVWNKEGIELRIIIVPPFWEQTWFRILVGFLLCGLPLLIYFYRLRVVRKQNQRLESQVQVRTEEIQLQNIQIEGLVEELQHQNSQLEKIVQQRTETLERSNLELKRSNQDLEQFAYIASHDLQEPLRTIGSFTQLLARRYKDKIDKDGQFYLKNTLDGVRRMSALIKSLLNYSRLGRRDVEFSPQNIREIIENKISDLSVKIEEKQAIIILENLPKMITCEPNQIGIVFYNLINNGIKFNQNETPKVTIKLNEESENYWTFSVKDNGIGINQVYKDKIFEIFKRLHTISEYDGNGIGLAFCKRIIHRHEGNIWFDSELGQGTTFYFTVYKKLTTNLPNLKDNQVLVEKNK